MSNNFDIFILPLKVAYKYFIFNELNYKIILEEQIMTLGNKIKNIKVRLCLSQEDLSNILNVSRQVVSKWETDNEIPDIINLQELSKVLDISIDNLLSNVELPKLKMKIELDKKKYKNILTSYKEILDDYFKNHDI